MSTTIRKCAKCQKIIKGGQFLTCACCHLIFDLTCSNKEKLYYLMDKEKKSTWKCIKCIRNKENSSISKKTSTSTLKKAEIVTLKSSTTTNKPKPLTPETTEGSVHSPTTRSNLSRTDMDLPFHDYVTLRNKKPAINVPIHNSFDSLQSYCEESMDSDTDDTPCKVNRSCPEIIVKSHLDYEALQIKHNNLQEKYESAEHQIELLLAENFSMKKKLAEYEVKMVNLSSICHNVETSSASKNKVNSTSKKNIQRKSMRISETYTSGPDFDIEVTEPSSTTKKLPQHVIVTNKISQTRKQMVSKSPKENQLSILSSNTRNKILKLALSSFQDEYQICHYLTPHKGILDMLESLDEKIKQYTMNDYCILMVGEEDFKKSQNYSELVKNIRHKLIDKVHTNIIICTPTFKCGRLAGLFNRRIESFTRLINSDVLKYEYAYLLDSNLHLSYDHKMFSGPQGTINNTGMNIVLCDLKSLIKKLEFYLNKDVSNLTDANFDTAKNEFFRE